MFDLQTVYYSLQNGYEGECPPSVNFTLSRCKYM